MFERSAEKVKSVAKVIFYVNMIIAGIILMGAFIFASQMRYGGGMVVLYAVVIDIIIILIAWVTSIFMVAFGDLVESNQQILELLHKQLKNKENSANVKEKNYQTNQNKGINGANNNLHSEIVNSKQDINERDEKVVIRKKIEPVDTIGQFCDLIDKFLLGEINKEDLINIKNDSWFKITQTFMNSTIREEEKMREAYERGIISIEEYEVFKYATNKSK